MGSKKKSMTFLCGRTRYVISEMSSLHSNLCYLFEGSGAVVFISVVSVCSVPWVRCSPSRYYGRLLGFTWWYTPYSSLSRRHTPVLLVLYTYSANIIFLSSSLLS